MPLCYPNHKNIRVYTWIPLIHNPEYAHANSNRSDNTHAIERLMRWAVYLLSLSRLVGLYIDCRSNDVAVYFSRRHTVLPAQLTMIIILTVGSQLDIFIQRQISITSALVFVYQQTVQCKWWNSVSFGKYSRVNGKTATIEHDYSWQFKKRHSEEILPFL
jgi:hypothetical protein